MINHDVIPIIKINGEDLFYSAEEISALIIKKMINCAEDFIQTYQKIEKAVITTPANFRDEQKNAIINAAKLAGIERIKIIDNPIAAALAYDIGNNLVSETKITLNSSDLNKEEEVPLSIGSIKQKSQKNVIVFDFVNVV